MGKKSKKNKVEVQQPKKSKKKYDTESESESDAESYTSSESPPDLINDGEWNTSLLGCCSNMKGCCCAFLCAPFYACYLFSKSEELCCTPYICPCALVALRTKIRVVYKIKGALWKDYCAASICAWCSMVQMANELRHQGIDLC